MNKVCTLCKRELPIDQFGLAKARRGGRECWCKECCNRRLAEYRATPDGRRKHLEAEKQRHMINPEPGRIRARQWHESNKDRIRKNQSAKGKARRLCPVYRLWEATRQREWYRRNPARGVAKARLRKTAQINAAPTWLTPIHHAQIQEIYDLAAALSVQTGVKHHVDHIVPLRGKTASGLHVPWNLRAIPAGVNCAKANKLPPEDDLIARRAA